ncbi:cystathionine beta-lyase [Agrobacterium rubi]|uniref:Cystathionine beta-lyase n=1 Tax=Agrobacterium rubi TaxID=28099 RepID=A0AAE7R3U4_9HYPH|nr:cystathionine beta-lyase [Agrobacterium rubi]NTE86205.1 cystathionine beta-lyase [Agrobacterium rubi]NTF02136.1 cystathionine beta-lyase [Agrobacterium rubi]NTF36380.1 cystathionine beta-lyase [Agrobacterium rubi]OCJ44346.1 cystathionine beta-lyase [Agrobacterium rubi]QTG01455.1 cystathionine beta-lyase [Agrobacterium rubi]
MKDRNGFLGAAGTNTRLAHLGNDPANYHGFVNPPIVRGSTVLFPDARTLVSEDQTYTYGTHGTPTTDALCNMVNALEGSAGTILLPSGLAAVTVPFMAYLSAGDHALIVDSVYYPTRRFCNKMLKQFGVEVEYYDPAIGAGIEALIRPNTRLLHLEAPGSNTFEMQDVALMSSIAHKYECVVTMDNTWATPLYFRPMDHGVDVSIHAATKYPAGHSDVLMGFVSANEKHWKKLYDTNTDIGLCVTSDDAYQVLRGMRTMGIRLEHHGKSALEIAQWLESRDDVARVLHPALPSFPTHDIWKRDFKGASGVFSFVLKAQDGRFTETSHAFLDALSIFGLGFSWGGYESLAIPVSLRDRTIAKGPTEGPVIRLQIGLEDVDDIKRDLEAGFAAAAAA